MSGRIRRPRVRPASIQVIERPATVTASRALLGHALLTYALLSTPTTSSLVQSLLVRVNGWRAIGVEDLEDSLALLEQLELIPAAPTPDAAAARFDEVATRIQAAFR